MGIIQRQAKSVGEVFDAVKYISKSWSPDPSQPQELWFRGVSKSSYHLLPGLYREENRELDYDEGSLFESFRATGSAYLSERLLNDWDWYYLAQSHGLVTRLLDWTQNLLAGIYFAVYQEMEKPDRRAYDLATSKPKCPSVFDAESPAIWVLDAGSLNAFCCADKKEDIVFIPGGPLTESYLPACIAAHKKDHKNRYPIAIFPPCSNQRIIAQRCVFTLHGHDKTPIDQLAQRHGRIQVKLGKIVLDRANLPCFWEDLEYGGVNKVSMFPGLDSVAYLTKWEGQYPKLSGRK